MRYTELGRWTGKIVNGYLFDAHLHAELEDWTDFACELEDEVDVASGWLISQAWEEVSAP